MIHVPFANGSRRHSAVAVAFAMLVAQYVPAARAPLAAQQASPAVNSSVPAPPADVTAGKAYATLERNCAGCHQAGRISDPASAAAFDNILALDDIARSRWLVRAGLPDASRLYNVALTGERHVEIYNDPAISLPTASEVQDLRDWIAELPAEPPLRCAHAVEPDPAEVGRLLGKSISALAPETARLTRFVTLSDLAATCAGQARLAHLQSELSKVQATAGPPGNAVSEPLFVPVDEQRLVWRMSLRHLDLKPEDWDRYTAASPYLGVPGRHVPAGVSAAVAARTPWMSAGEFATALWRDKRPLPPGMDTLARTWSRPAGAAQFAADLWMPLKQVEQRLASTPSPLSIPARRLLEGGTADRTALARLARFLTAGEVAPADASEPLEIALWSDKPSYAAGDTARFSVETNHDCYLTLVGIDRSGRGTVLYPSEFEPANLLVKGKVLNVPAVDAPYRLRLKDKGRESVVAICSRTQKAPPGIAHDFDRLRFTMLGDWQLFLREPPEMKEARRDDAATDIPRPQARPRRRRTPDPKAAHPAAPEADVQTRTAISITID